MLLIPLALLFRRAPRDPVAVAVGQMLMLGFHGTTSRSVSARLLAAQLAAGRVGGVFFVSSNIGSRGDVAGLLRLFKAHGGNPLLAIDHEGGIVQRLTAVHGFTTLPSAHDVANTMSPSEARTVYETAGRELGAIGFNVNLAPVVDFHDHTNPAIGAFGRSYGVESDRIVSYATAFIEGFDASSILCALKHFPGHGHSRGDSHNGPADISATWSEAELLPFARLIAAGRAPMVMSGHLRLDPLDPGVPTTVSTIVITGLLRDRLRFEGVAITDDLDMDAVRGVMGRRQASIRAIAAGNDILMIKNLFGFDPFLPRRVVRWVDAAISDGTVSREQILAAACRIRAMRKSFSAGSGE